MKPPPLSANQKAVLTFLDKNKEARLHVHSYSGSPKVRVRLQHEDQPIKLTYDALLYMADQKLVRRCRNDHTSSDYTITDAGRSALRGDYTDPNAQVNDSILAEGCEEGIPDDPVDEDVHDAPRAHPSYGVIGISHIQGRDVNLFGATIPHDHFINLKISRAESKRNDSTDWIHAKDTLVEVYLSYDQFVSLLFNSNGRETPCTIRYADGERMEEPPTPVSPRAQITNEFNRIVRSANENAKSLAEEASRLLKRTGSLGKEDKERLFTLLQGVVGNTSSNMEFVQERFQKAMDKSLTEVLAGKEGGSRSLGGSVQHKIEDQSE